MSELLNLVGLSIGVVLYAMLLAMVLRAGHTPGSPLRVDRLALATSVLGLVWNLCALPAYELPNVGVSGPFPFLNAIGFTALGLLPAVVVHSVLRGDRDGVRGPARRAIAAAAYASSLVAALLHFGAAFTGGVVPSVAGMRLLTYTFVALVLPLAVITRGQPSARRALWAAALATFAVSALHLSQVHRGDASWPVELLGHHASLPLAFAILYQDYPFALADLFLKRALSLLGIVTIAFALIVGFGARSESFARFVAADPRLVGVMVTLWVGTALLYPVLAKATVWLVDVVILSRPDYRSLTRALTRRAQQHDDVETLMADVCETLAPALSSTAVTWREWHSDDEGGVIVTPKDPLAAVVIVPAADAPRYAIAIAALTGGRRLLSDDRAALEAIATMVARRIDAIRVTRERYEQQLREREMTALATEAELRALRAQMNPHFLFNALTTIGYLVKAAPDRALDTLMRLTALLRGVLRSDGAFTTLGREIELVEAYLNIERARFEERLQVAIDVPQNLRSIAVPPLLLQPIVENAVKHGIGTRQAGGTVTVRARLGSVGPGQTCLWMVVHDTGAGSTLEALERGRARGVGLRNIERRLERQYGPAAALSIQTAEGAGTTVEIRVPADVPAHEEAERRWNAR